MCAKPLDFISGVVAVSVLLSPILSPNVTATVCWLQQLYGANSNAGTLLQYKIDEIYCIQLCMRNGSCQAVDYDVRKGDCFAHPNTVGTEPSSYCVRYHYTCNYTKNCTSDGFETFGGKTSVNRQRLGIVQPAVRNEAQCQSFCVTYGVNCTRAITYPLNATHLACLLYTTLSDNFTTSNNSEKVHMRKFCRPIPSNATTTRTANGLTTPSTILKSITTTTKSTTTTRTTIGLTTSTTTTKSEAPSVFSIWPLYGPVAGGTRMTISGHLINRLTVRAVLIGSYQLTPDRSNSTSTTSADFISVVTPAINETLQRHLPIAVELTDGFILTTNFSFDYRDNPKFVDIQPREHLLVGGTQLTVNGSSLDSVADPSITVTVVVNRFSNVTTMAQSTADGKCWFPEDADAVGHTMLCRMPRATLPPDFDGPQNRTSIWNISETSGVAVYYGPNGRDRADVYVGLQLDGLTRYNNISEVKPDIKMMFYGQPTISCDDKVAIFNPRKDNAIIVKGSNLARGSRLVDFNITVGTGVCENVDLTDNQVTCRPPKKRPPANHNSSYCNDQLSVDLSIGNAPYHCSCLRYEDSSKANVALIVGLTVGLGVPLLLLIAGLVAVYYRRVHSTTDSREAKGQQKAEKGVKSKTYDELYKNDLSYAQNVDTDA